MPLFERYYSGTVQSSNGEPIRPISPAFVLRQAGPCLEVTVAVTPDHATKLSATGEEPPEPAQGLALIDTGASITAVDETICRRLGLKPTNSLKLGHAAGSEDRLCYPVQIEFPGTTLKPLINPQAVSCDLRSQENFILLFGRDLLMHLRMVYNGPFGRIELAY